MSIHSFRRIRFSIAVLILLSVLYAPLFAAEKHHHHCTGEHCPVCQYLHVCRTILREITIPHATFCAEAVPRCTSFSAAVHFQSVKIDTTLITLQVQSTT